MNVQIRDFETAYAQWMSDLCRREGRYPGEAASSRKGAPKNPWTQCDLAKLFAMKRDGFKDAEIAARLGRGVKSVKGKLESERRKARS